MPRASMIGGINRKSYWLLVAVTISLLPFLLFAGYSIVQLVQGKQDDLSSSLDLH